ncbi:hypothetical protein [Sinomonas humi]|uniref:hypothetical protein n=1 Tax=Sinomonas humi TaxID=1338436 RepID=UPI000691C4B0|nr:hypothetical protein [Sinomonas humi]
MDTSRPPLGETRRGEILGEIVSGGDVAEKHYLEVKSELDLVSKEEATKVAKFILGAANRLPSLAARDFGGYAVMVIGAKQGGLPGVPAGTEILAIEQKIGKYLGPGGPRWELERAPADTSGREVLFIIVDPPKDGDPVYPCRADYQSASGGRNNLSNGDIYVRGPGETRKAKAAEVEGLVARANSGALPAPEFAISLRGSAHLLDVSNERLDQYVESEIAEARRKHVESAPTKSPNSSFISEATWSNLMSAAGMSHMSSDSFEHVAAEWEQSTRSTWVKGHVELAGAALPRLVIEVANQRTMFLEAVRIDLVLDEAFGVAARGPRDVDLDELFPPVIKASSPFHVPIPPIRIPRPAIASRQLSWENQGRSLHITVELEHLRPETPWISPADLVVLALSPGAKSLSVRWQATARGYHETFKGTAEVPVGGEYTLAQLADLLPV